MKTLKTPKFGSEMVWCFYRNNLLSLGRFVSSFRVNAALHGNAMIISEGMLSEVGNEAGKT